MKRLLLVLFFTGILCAGDWKMQVEEIDAQIEELQHERMRVLGRASRLEDNAIRWQFMPDQYNETRQAYRQVDALRKQAQILEGIIDELQQKKQTLLQEHVLDKCKTKHP